MRFNNRLLFKLGIIYILVLATLLACTIMSL